MYAQNGYDGGSETVNVLARHTAWKRCIATEIRWYRNVFPRIGCAKRGCSADFCYETV